MEERILTNKERQKRRTLSYFIEAAQRIIAEEGIQGVSIRKIADQAGYNSATLYNYFEDVDELTLIASIKYYLSYTSSLAQHVRALDDSYEWFMEVWDFFCDAAFSHPRIFYTLFFGKYNDRLSDAVVRYYEIFPEEKGKYSAMAEYMFSGQSILERNQRQMDCMVEAGYVARENAVIANEILTFTFQKLLEDACKQETSPEKHREMKEHMMRIVAFSIDRAR